MEEIDSKLTPLQLTQLNTVRTLFKTIELDYEQKDKGYNRTTKHLVSLLWKYMPKIMQQEIKSFYLEMEQYEKEINNSKLNAEQQESKIIKHNHDFSDKILDLCVKALINSPIVEESIDLDLESDIDRDELKKMISSTNITKLMQR